MEDVKANLLTELYHYFPELEGMTIHHEYFQHRDDFPGFHTNQYAQRPEVLTDVPGFYLAGDWVRMNNCGMLMEAAYTSGAMAGNSHHAARKTTGKPSGECASQRNTGLKINMTKLLSLLLNQFHS
jgi:isorenieratene synthase